MVIETDRKVLVVAGTHNRETGFSHPTADLIISHYGGSASKPQEEFIGIDKARKAELWDFGKIAVAKIQKIGEPAIDYIETLPPDRLFYLARFRIQNMFSGAEVAETFGQAQWTSVHDPLLEKSKPSFFFDLHSHHRFTEGMTGTGAYITPYARQDRGELVAKALTIAQYNEPQVYGRLDAGRCPIGEREKEEIIVSTAQDYFSRDELVKILAMTPKDVHSSRKTKNFAKRLERFERGADKRIAEHWGNQWYFNSNFGRYGSDVFDNFCFEAVHWRKDNQAATARFVTRYLAELL